MHLMRAQFSWCPKKLKINRIIPYIRFIRLALIDSKIGEILDSRIGETMS